ncbi:MAG: hypothetical protein N4Q32_02095, partial [Neisseriaceae bacterium]|nr:hypothetical protein [Neisseriaceae bacterium]
MFAGFYYVPNYVVYSDNEIKTLLIDYFKEKDIKISFDDIKTNLFLRPSVELKNVHLVKESVNKDYDLIAKKIRISLSYKIFWNKIKVHQLSIFDSSLYVNYKKSNKELIQDDSHLKEKKSDNIFLIPKYIESHNGKIILEDKAHHYGIVFENIELKISTPKNYTSYVEMGGITSNNELSEYPITFNLQGALDFTSENIIGKHLDLSFW